MVFTEIETQTLLNGFRDQYIAVSPDTCTCRDTKLSTLHRELFSRRRSSRATDLGTQWTAQRAAPTSQASS